MSSKHDAHMRIFFALRACLPAAFLLLAVPLRAAFRDMVWGARPAGLGGAYAALSDDAHGPLANPAGTARVTRPQVLLSYASLFSGLKLYAGQETSAVDLGSLAFVDRRREWGSLGFYWNAFQAKGVYREDTAGLSWGNSLGGVVKGLSVGAGLKMLRHAYEVDGAAALDPVFRGGRSKSAVGLDLGLQWEPLPDTYPGLRVAFAGRNLNSPDVGLSQRDRVPAEARLGVALERTHLLVFSPVLELSFRDGRTEVSGGLEKWFMSDTLALRAGGSSQDVAAGFSYRFGLGTGEDRPLQVDYAMSWPLYVDDTAGTHRLSLAFRFGAQPPAPARFARKTGSRTF
jgi:hypothetical protein